MNASKSSPGSFKMTTMYKMKEYTMKPNRRNFSAFQWDGTAFQADSPNSRPPKPLQIKIKMFEKSHSKKEASFIHFPNWVSIPPLSSLQYIFNYFHINKEYLQCCLLNWGNVSGSLICWQFTALLVMYFLYSPLFPPCTSPMSCSFLKDTEAYRVE